MIFSQPKRAKADLADLFRTTGSLPSAIQQEMAPYPSGKDVSSWQILYDMLEKGLTQCCILVEMKVMTAPGLTFEHSSSFLAVYSLAWPRFERDPGVFNAHARGDRVRGARGVRGWNESALRHQEKGSIATRQDGRARCLGMILCPLKQYTKFHCAKYLEILWNPDLVSCESLTCRIQI